MTRSRITALLAVTVTTLAPLALAWFFGQATGTVSGHPRDASPVPASGRDADGTGKQSGHFAGVSSCSARGCHGGLEANPSGTAQNEYSIWASQDLHGQAYTVLLDERGNRIARNLGIADASKDVRCLACHVAPGLAKDVASFSGTHPLAADGVSCEACHGPASVPNASWLTEHTRESWKANSDKQRYHMVALGDLKVQAATCVGCHVGAPADPEAGVPARDCNHDIMAAGHPRLTFELASFRENMPPHWRKSKQETEPSYDARTWAVGQVATAQAAVDLLRDRALRAQGPGASAPWPEFAEADCFSCHAGLRVPSWRREGNVKTRPLGSIPYSDWHTFMLPYVAPAAQAAAVAEPFQKLRELMNKPHPQPKEVVAACDQLKAPLSALSTLVSGAKYDRDACRSTLARMRTDGTKPAQPLCWEEAEQFTLGVAALAGGAELDKEKWQPALNDLWKHDLAFPKGEESPGNFRADAAGFETRWKKLIESLPPESPRK